MDQVQIVPGCLGRFETGEIGLHDRAVARDGEDQRHVDRYAFGQNGGDRGETGQGGGNLDQHIGPVDDLPQLDRLQDRLVGLVRQSRVDLDRDPAVDAVGGHPLRPENVAGPADVVGGGGADGGVDVGAARCEFGDLGVVGGALRERGLEDRRVRGDAHHALGVDQLLEVAAIESIAGQVVEPDGNARRRQFREIAVLCHGNSFGGSVVECSLGGGGDRLRGETELAEQGFVVGGGAVVLQRDDLAAGDELVPALRDSGFHGDPCRDLRR